MKGVKRQMTFSELLDLETVLGFYGGSTQGKLCFAVARNISAIKTPLAAYREALQPTEAMREFDKRKMQLLDKHATKDERGRPVREPVKGRPGSWKYDLEDEEEYNKAISKVPGRKKAEKDAEELIEKEREIKEDSEEVVLYQLKFDSLREDENGNLPVSAVHLSFLMDVGIIVFDDDEDQEEGVEEDPTPISKAKKKRKKAK